MHILYVSHYFPPEMGAPAARVHEVSREWVRLGHQVTALAGFAHHPLLVKAPRTASASLAGRSRTESTSFGHTSTAFPTRERECGWPRTRRSRCPRSWSERRGSIAPTSSSRRRRTFSARAPATLWPGGSRVPFLFERRSDGLRPTGRGWSAWARTGGTSCWSTTIVAGLLTATSRAWRRRSAEDPRGER